MAERATIARPYAKAAFDFAQAAHTLAEWSQGLRLAAEIVADTRVAALVKDPERTPADIAGFIQAGEGDFGIGGGGDVVNVGLIVILLFLFELRTA